MLMEATHVFSTIMETNHNLSVHYTVCSVRMRPGCLVNLRCLLSLPTALPKPPPKRDVQITHLRTTAITVRSNYIWATVMFFFIFYFFFYINSVNYVAFLSYGVVSKVKR